MTTLSKADKAADALGRAVSGQSTMNYGPIIDGFLAKGIARDDIKPRENIFTYDAWQAAGRQVRKGEHGVKCVTFIAMKGKRIAGEESDSSRRGGRRRPWRTTVFHISQTDAIPGQEGTALPVRGDTFDEGLAGCVDVGLHGDGRAAFLGDDGWDE